MKITNEFLADLEAKAKAATGGKWLIGPFQLPCDGGGLSLYRKTKYRWVSIHIDPDEDCEFIVAAQPAHVLALIAELREAHQTIARLREDAIIAFEEGRRR